MHIYRNQSSHVKKTKITSAVHWRLVYSAFVSVALFISKTIQGNSQQRREPQKPHHQRTHPRAHASRPILSKIPNCPIGSEGSKKAVPNNKLTENGSVFVRHLLGEKLRTPRVLESRSRLELHTRTFRVHPSFFPTHDTEF